MLARLLQTITGKSFPLNRAGALVSTGGPSVPLHTHQWQQVWQIIEHLEGVLPEDRLSRVAALSPDPGVAERVLACLAEMEDGRETPDDADRSGQIIGHYRLVRQLGRGGMGEVYEAVDTSLGRTVAIKFLVSGTEDPGLVESFMNEARAASALNHPNIVTVYEFLREPETVAIVMERVEGHTLRSACRTRMPLPEFRRCAAQMAQALAAAHARGIVHRDVKPENIMVRDDGLIKLLDFGIARLTAAPAWSVSDARATTPAGTLRYMSPEQIAGHTLQPASDVFSLGLVFFEVLAGGRPFEARTEISTLDDLSASRIPPIRSVRKHVPAAVDRLLRSMTAVEPAARPTALQVAGTLSRTGAHGTRTWALLASGLALVLVTFAVWATLREPRPRRYNGALFTTLPGSEITPSLFPDGAKVAYAWDGLRRDNFDIYVQRLRGGAGPIRLTTDPAPDYSPVSSPDGRSIVFLRGRMDGKSRILLIPAQGGPERLLAEIRLQPSIYTRALDWSRDGRWVVFSDIEEDTRGTCLFVVSIENGQRRQLTRSSRDTHHLPAVSPDGATIAFIADREGIGQIALLPVDSSFRPKANPSLLDFPGFQGYLCLSPRWLNNRELLFTSNKGGNDRAWTVSLSGLKPAAPPARMTGLEEEVNAPDVSRDGATVMYSRRVADSNIYELKMSPKPRVGAHPRALLGSTRQERNAQISPDGSRIAFESDRSAYPEIWISDRDGDNAFAVTDFRGPVTGSPRWMPDGKSLVFDTRIDGAPEIYTATAEPRGKLRNVTRHPASDILPSVSPDGRWIYFLSNRTGYFCVWKIPAAGGDAVQVSREASLGPVASPDNKYLYYMIGPPRDGTLRRHDLNKGTAETIANHVRDRSYAPAQSGIYFVRAAGPKQWEIAFASSARRGVRLIAPLDPLFAGGLSLSPDEGDVVFSRMDQEGSDLILARRTQ